MMIQRSSLPGCREYIYIYMFYAFWYKGLDFFMYHQQCGLCSDVWNTGYRCYRYRVTIRVVREQVGFTELPNSNTNSSMVYRIGIHLCWLPLRLFPLRSIAILVAACCLSLPVRGCGLVAVMSCVALLTPTVKYLVQSKM